MQLSLFDHVKAAYADIDQPISQTDLYRTVARTANLSEEDLERVEPVGQNQTPCRVLKREIRWHQQTLKHAGLIQPSGRRGQWELTGKGKTRLRKIRPKASMVAFSTRLGAALWSLNEDVFSSIDAPITLCLTSPPYPLRCARAYGNPSLDEYIEFVVTSLRPIAENLERGGSVCLNISNDIFEPGSPARSLYREQLVLTMARELGLWKMDEIPWENPCKPPGPIQWASKTRQQLNTTWEPVYWFSNDPVNVKADNRRVLLPHTEKHKAFVAAGGVKVARIDSDGAYRKRKGAYSNETEGRIPRNILKFPHNCPSQRRYKEAARKLGLPVHGAPFPLALAVFLIQFLSEPGDLVVDCFGGSLTTGVGAEENGRRWLLTECMWEYLRGGGERYVDFDGFSWEREFRLIDQVA